MAELTQSTERIFRIPFLSILNKCGKTKTEDIIDILRNDFCPEGHDAEIISGRSDDYFSQKVRNVKSHSSIKEYAKYINKKDGWEINEAGINFLSEHAEEVEEIERILSNDSFNYFEKITFIDQVILPFYPRRTPSKKAAVVATPKKKAAVPKKVILFYDENVSEGKTYTKTVVVRERSKSLRDKAITHFTVDDKIKCSICGFEFANDYGDYGKGYIEIHHKKPVYQYDDKDIDAVLSAALENLTPVCSNCHRMLHHKKGVSYDEVKKIYEENHNDK